MMNKDNLENRIIKEYDDVKIASAYKITGSAYKVNVCISI